LTENVVQTMTVSSICITVFHLDCVKGSSPKLTVQLIVWTRLQNDVS